MQRYKEAPVPENEKERLESLHRLKILDTPPEARFDNITKLALLLFKVPISTITLIDSQREWFKSCQGLSSNEGKRAISFCGHAMMAEDVFIIPDAKKDPKFAQNPMVLGKPYIRFYAAVPLKAAGGQRIGAFCIKDYKRRNLSNEESEWLRILASWAEIEINAHELSLALSARRQAEIQLSEANDVLKILNKILRHDLLNHLTVIKGNLDFLRKRVVQRYIKELDTAADQSVDLIRSIGQLESTILTGVSLKPYHVTNILEKVMQLFPSIKFKIQGEGMVLADEALISVIENIVRNAKMHGKTKKIEIKIAKQDNLIKIRIADFGKGIPGKIRDKLFTEGFKYGLTGNTGLGLYIAKKTMLRYGGDITVSNNKPKGVVFTLNLSAAS